MRIVRTIDNDQDVTTEALMTSEELVDFLKQRLQLDLFCVEFSIEGGSMHGKPRVEKVTLKFKGDVPSLTGMGKEQA